MGQNKIGVIHNNTNYNARKTAELKALCGGNCYEQTSKN